MSTEKTDEKTDEKRTTERPGVAARLKALAERHPLPGRDKGFWALMADAVVTAGAIAATYFVVVYTVSVVTPGAIRSVAAMMGVDTVTASVQTATIYWFAPSLMLLGFIFALDLAIIRGMWRAWTRFVHRGRAVGAEPGRAPVSMGVATRVGDTGTGTAGKKTRDRGPKGNA